MKSKLLGILLTLSALTLAGCASGKMTFTKAGITSDQQMSDSAECWKSAQVAREPDEIAAANAVGALIGGGVAAMATTVIMSSMADDDPKNPYRRSAHLDCMKSKGYAAKGDFYRRAYTTKPKPEYEEDSDDNNGIGMHRLKKKKPTSKSASAAAKNNNITTGSVN